MDDFPVGELASTVVTNSGRSERIQDAYGDVSFGDGIDIYEANGLDDYADDTEPTRLRQLDEPRH